MPHLWHGVQATGRTCLRARGPAHSVAASHRAAQLAGGRCCSLNTPQKCPWRPLPCQQRCNILIISLQKALMPVFLLHYESKGCAAGCQRLHKHAATQPCYPRHLASRNRAKVVASKIFCISSIAQFGLYEMAEQQQLSGLLNDTARRAGLCSRQLGCEVQPFKEHFSLLDCCLVFSIQSRCKTSFSAMSSYIAIVALALAALAAVLAAPAAAYRPSMSTWRLPASSRSKISRPARGQVPLRSHAAAPAPNDLMARCQLVWTNRTLDHFSYVSC